MPTPPLLRDDFELGEVLGVGTVGTIYAATRRSPGESPGQRVAVKILHATVSSSAVVRARFRREMMILDRLQHPNIIGYLGGGEDDGQLFYVMELVEGGTVKNLLERDGPLAWPAVAEIGRQLCSALQYAHNHGVVHRDLKPSNLFLTPNGEIKLGDFGIARDLEQSDITLSGMTVGTHAYMSPEQIKGEATITGKADLYSLGCCLFEMLVGETPFQAENFAQLFEQHLNQVPPRIGSRVADCPAALDTTVAELLAKDPVDRPFNARAVQAVMLRLDESHASGDAGSTQAGSTQAGSRQAGSRQAGSRQTDVAAGEVISPGRRLLRRKIRQRMADIAQPGISWRRLVAVVAVLAAVVAAASLLRT